MKERKNEQRNKWGTLPREIFKNQSCFLHSESHFNHPSQIKWTFAVHEGVRTHALHPTAYGPGWVDTHGYMYTDQYQL